MLYIINAFSGNVNVLSVNILFSHRIIIETEVIRAVAGLGVLKHYAVTVIRLAADDSNTVVVPDIQVEIFFMRTCYMQACLAYVNFEGISNSDIRKIFGLGEKEKAKASRLLTSAVDGGYIKVMDPDTAPRYKKYIPYWA